MTNSMPISPGESFQSFLDRAMTVPLLSKEQEIDLFRAMVDHNDQVARDTLFLANVRLVVRLSKIYSAYKLDQNELIQEGLAGMARRMTDFDPEKGVRFGAFISYSIKEQMINYLTANLRSIKVITNQRHRKIFFNIGRYKRHGRWLSPDDREALASELNVSVDDVRDMEGRLATNEPSIATQEPTDDTPLSQNQVAPLIDGSAGPEELVENTHDQTAIRSLIDHAIESLTENQADVIRARYFSPPGSVETYREIAARLGMTRQAVQQLEQRGLARLSHFSGLSDAMSLSKAS